MRHFHKQIAVFFLSLFVGVIAFSHITIANESSSLAEKRVLLLYSYHPTFITSERILDGVQSVLGTYSLTLDIEYMDSKRHPDKRHINNFIQMFSNKLSKRPPYDLVLISDDNALNFMLEYQDRFFPQTPVVFMAVNNVAKAIQMDEHSYITGVVEAVSPEQSIELARSIHKPLKKVTVVVDDTASGKGDQARLKNLYSKFSDIDFTVLLMSELSWDELASQLRKLTKDSVVLRMATFRDKEGTVLSYAHSLNIMVKNSPAPVYTLREHGVLNGAFGGNVVSFYEQGRQAALMAEKVLKGTPISSIKVLRESPNLNMFHYPSLQHFDIPESTLPQESIILNKPFSVYEQYYWEVWFVLGSISLLSGLVIFLLWHVSARKQAEERFRLVVNSSPNALAVVNQQGKITLVNSQLEKIFGYSREDLIGQFVEILVPERFRNKHNELRIAFNAEPQTRVMGAGRDLCGLRKDGSEIPIEVGLSSFNTAEGPMVLNSINDITERKKTEEILRILAESASINESDEFFRNCIRDLADLYEVRFAFFGLLNENKKRIRTLAVWAGDDFTENFEYNLDGTPCQDVLDLKIELIPNNVSCLYPKDTLLVDMGIDSYFGAPLISSEQSTIGIVSVMDTKPMKIKAWTAPILRVFAKRIAIELERKSASDKLYKLNVSLESRVKQRTFELEMTNRELESFSYSVSHDLRAPLRSIDGFSHALMEEYKDKLDETGKDYIERVRKAVQRMGDLIDDLLNLSRISRHTISYETSELSAFANDIAASLRESEPDRQVHFKVQKGLTVQGDTKLLRIVLNNLLSNAWKFSSNVTKPRIEFGSIKQNGKTVYYVKDNGTGFDMQYVKKLFGAFERLHSPKEFEGIGIGLATVQRIINRHGGRVWAEGEVGKGATFYFTLVP